MGWTTYWTSSQRVPRDQKTMRPPLEITLRPSRSRIPLGSKVQAEIMGEIGAVHWADTCQSTYYIKEFQLLLTLYVDDILLSGPKESHQKFWEMLQKHIEIEDPTSVDRVLGRRHIITRMNVAWHVRFCRKSMRCLRRVEWLCQCVEEGNDALSSWRVACR